MRGIGCCYAKNTTESRIKIDISKTMMKMVKWNRNNEMAFQLCKYQILQMNEMFFSLTKTETISLLEINIYIYIVELEKNTLSLHFVNIVIIITYISHVFFFFCEFHWVYALTNVNVNKLDCFVLFILSNDKADDTINSESRRRPEAHPHPNIANRWFNSFSFV